MQSKFRKEVPVSATEEKIEDNSVIGIGEESIEDWYCALTVSVFFCIKEAE
jgi:hypothetical protein